MGATQQILLANGGGGAPVVTYNDLIAAMTPSVWWRLDETAGTTAVDSSGNGRDGAINGGATFATATIAAPSGCAGFGTGVDSGVASFTDVRAAIGPPGVLFGAGSASKWTVGVVCAGGAGSGYLASRQNDAAIIHNFVSGQVEFFASGFTGSDPRPGSQIPLSTVDTTTPHLIVYRYDNGNWCGLLDGVEIFNVTRSFSCVTSHTNTYLASDSGPSAINRRFWDFFVINDAPSTADIAAAWAARTT